MLRPYQNEAIDRLKNSLKKGNKKVILTLATGSGKSIIARAIVEMAAKKGNDVLFLAHRTILVNQMKQTFKGLDNVTVGTIQALSKKEHNHKIIIIDEIHYGFGSSMHSKLHDAIIIGLSATPIQSDGSKLEGFDDIIDVVQLCDLIDMGYASPIKVLAPIKQDLSNVKIKAGDYDNKQSFEAMSKSEIVSDIIGTYKKHAEGLRTLVYCVNIAHAEIMAKEFIKQGYRADSVHSKKDSEEVMERFKNQEIDIVFNVEVLTTGVDLPDVYCIILASPTKSIIKAVQIYGRCTRLNPKDKDKTALILDCANVVTDTVHPLQRLRFDKEKRDRNIKKCKCGGILALFDKKASKPNSDGFYTVTTTRICNDCKRYYTDEETAMLPIKPCGCSADNKVIMDQTDKEAVFYLECQGCGAKEDYRKILLTDAELEEIKPTDLNTWGHVRRELRKATNKDGKKYHWMWAGHVIDNLKERGAKPEMIIKEIEKYNLNGWKLGGLVHAVKIS